MNAAAIPVLLFLYGVLASAYFALAKPGTSRQDIAIILGTLLMGILRFSVPGHGFSWPGSYEAIAHIICGMLLMLACQKNWLALEALVIVTIFEGVMFAAR